MSTENYNELLTKLVSEHKSQQLLDFVKKNPDYNYYFTDSNGSNLLHVCVEKTSSSMLETLQVLVNQGLDARAVNAMFKSPINIANDNDNIAAVAYLKNFIMKRDMQNQNELNKGTGSLDDYFDAN